MRAGYWRSVAAVSVIGAAGLVAAQDLAKLTETQRTQLNGWMAERAERMIAAHRLEGELDQAVSDTANTSPEIEALRKRCRELQTELSRVQADLKKKVMALPALQGKRTRLEQERQGIDELSKKVKALTDSAR